MNSLLIEPKADTPKVYLDKEQNIFEISKISLPEDAIEFYSPIFSWLEEYKNEPNEETFFDFKLEYFNTASSKQIIQILLMLSEINKIKPVTVRWHYRDIDEDMLEIGKEYSLLIKTKFEFIEYKV